jgi:3-methyladenine DNA glycosylase AlkD
MPRRAEKTPARRAASPGRAKVLPVPDSATGWTFGDVMAQLEKAGTEQNRKVYRRHGAIDPLFGVSFANVKVMAKKIGTNHGLAAQLWASGNCDAMNLAAMIADPAAIDDAEAERWLASVKSYPTACSLAMLIGQAPCAESRIRAWIDSTDEYTRTCGYDTIGGYFKAGGRLGEEFLSNLIDRIEREIHGSANRARHSMNMALIGIGGSRESLREKAIAAARRIGKVEVDHGETSCVTPDAVSYIEKMAARKR